MTTMQEEPEHTCARCGASWRSSSANEPCLFCFGQHRDPQQATEPAPAPRLVIVETPYAPRDGRTVEQHVAYARRCMKDSLVRHGEAPLLSHLLYTQVLDDAVEKEREAGIEAGLAWGRLASATVVYLDLGVSGGMKLGLLRARREGRTIEFRLLHEVPCEHERIVKSSPVVDWTARCGRPSEAFWGESLDRAYCPEHARVAIAAGLKRKPLTVENAAIRAGVHE